MNKQKFIYLGEAPLITIFLVITIFNIVIQPLNLILGIICTLFIPGFNLISILKPNLDDYGKIGYSFIISLAIENGFMFLFYVFFYTFATPISSRVYGVKFNPFVMNITIQLLNLISVIYLISKIKTNKSDLKQKVKSSSFNLKKENFDFKNLLLSLVFIISIICLGVSTIFSNIDSNDFQSNLVDYSSNFIFFLRVPPIFYFFLALVIISLIAIIFYSENEYQILIFISVFMYLLWILPYLQINNYFSRDAYLLYNIFSGYQETGLIYYSGYNLVVFNVDSLRYSTALFNSIILLNSTSTSTNFILWYLYPIIYITLPFFFYSVFKKFSKDQHYNKSNLIILSVLALFTPQFLKSGHTAGTGFLGIIIFFMLTLEFYYLINKDDFQFNLKEILLISFLYFFLCLTHTEECFYFLSLIIFYLFYYVFSAIIKNNALKSKIRSNLFIVNPIDELNNILKFRKIDVFKKQFLRNLLKLGLLLILCLGILQFTLSVFGWINYYFNVFLVFPFVDSIFSFYQETLIQIPFFLRGNLMLNFIFYFFLLLIIFIIIGLCFLTYLKLNSRIFNLYKWFLVRFTYIFKMFSKITKRKWFQILIFPIFYGAIIFINFNFFAILDSFPLLEFISLVLAYSIIIFHLYIFIKEIPYLSTSNQKQHFFLISIIASTTVFSIFLLSNPWVAVYIIHTKFLTYFIFFNLLIIQNSYFKNLMEKRKVYLIFLLTIIFLLGIFVSLRALRYG